MITTQQQIDELPFTISPSVSNLVVHAQEIGNTWIEFVAWYPAEDKHEVVRFSLHRFIAMKIGDLDSEINAIGIGQHEPSTWLEKVISNQNTHYPQRPDAFKDVRHFYVTGHDVSVEFLAEGFFWNTTQTLACERPGR